MQHKTERRKNRKMVSLFFSWKSGCDGDDGAFRGLIMRDTEDAAAAAEKKVSRSHDIAFPSQRRRRRSRSKVRQKYKGN